MLAKDPFLSGLARAASPQGPPHSLPSLLIAEISLMTVTIENAYHLLWLSCRKLDGYSVVVFLHGVPTLPPCSSCCCLGATDCGYDDDGDDVLDSFQHDHC